MANEYALTQEVYDQLKEELKELLATGRADIAEKLKEAKSFGDLSENSEYDEAKSDQAKMEARIAELQDIINNATILDSSQLSTETVHTGLVVKIFDRTYNDTAEYHIVGAPQADPMQNMISDESPVGKALLGHKVGDTVHVEIPDGFDELEILNIYRP
ncbi:MAG: transcription elongation factor GreA [Clostridia bacterium]|nr:transcription elongation factor GreA [Clostridia bacterium]